MSNETHLLEKHAAYQSLSNHLTQLPRKLTHPGLIPIAPRLFLPGELIRTNEILVLLGRSGEASYFAERTAWQAHQIVRRRLGHVEQGLRELLAGAEDLKITERQPSKRKKRVTFREPVVCASPPLKARPRPTSTTLPLSSLKQTCDTDRGAPSERAESINVGAIDQSHLNGKLAIGGADQILQQSPKELTTVNLVSSVPQEYMDVLRAAELDEDSSEEDIDERYVEDLGDDYSQFSSTSSNREKEEEASTLLTSSKRELESKIDKDSSEVSVQYDSEDTETRHKAISNKEGSSHEAEKRPEQQSIRREFQDALRNAERQAEQDGVVNLMEFYEDESDAPSHVNLPRNFQPDEAIDFEDDAEEYLDVTGESAKSTKSMSSTPGNYLQFLREEARKEEEEEQRKEAEKALHDSDESRKNLEKEKKEFGSGFAKGFFGAPSKRKGAVKEEQNNESSAHHIGRADASDLQETGAVEERVVERKTTRKTSRRHRKPKATVMPAVMSVATSQQEPSVEDDERAGRFTRIENVDEAQNSQMSKFRQLQRLKRASGGMSDR